MENRFGGSGESVAKKVREVFFRCTAAGECDNPRRANRLVKISTLKMGDI